MKSVFRSLEKELQTVQGYLSGKEAEEIAADYLKRKKYKILERNLKIGGTEIDILAKANQYLAIVEVKKRVSSQSGSPEEFVNHRKKNHLLRAAKILMAKRAFANLQPRFEIVAILTENSELKINHLIDVLEEE